MKMLPKISMFLAMLGLITFVACEKESNNVAVIPNKNLNGVSLKNGMLVFQDDASIAILAEMMQNDRKATIESVSSKFPTFISNQVEYEKIISNPNLENEDNSGFSKIPSIVTITNTNGVNTLEQTIDSYFLASISNLDGEFQVGNNIYRITRDFVYLLDPISAKVLSKHKITRTEAGLDERDATEAQLEFDDCTSKKKRIAAKIYFKTYLTYSEAGISARLEKNGFWGWVASTATSIRVTGSYTVQRFSVLSNGLCSETEFLGVSSPTNNNASSAEHVGTACWGCCGKGEITGNAANTTVTCNTTRGVGVVR